MINNLKTSIGKTLKKREGFWFRQRERQALGLFQKAAREIPAYKDFLKKNRIDPEKIKNFTDFQLVPPTNKKEYLGKYPFRELVWKKLEKSCIFSSTSGSTGEPYYFPRTCQLDWEASLAHEIFLRQDPRAKTQPTLVLVCFGMGVWIGGLITYKSFELAGARGYPISILTPGINKLEVLKALRKLGRAFKQIILAGYPPFIKDILDEAGQEGIDLSKYKIRLLFAAEVFTEKFRDYVAELAGIKNVCLDTMNIYGTAEMGAMAFETPSTILLRRILAADKNLYARLLPDISKTPTIAQYNPMFITFESISGNIVLTGNNAIPLIRYEIGDRGGVMCMSEIVSFLSQNGIDFFKEARRNGLGRYLYELPIVYVYERGDLSVTLYGLQIYPEIVREALLDPDLNRKLTGRLTLATTYDYRQNQCLEINLELQKGQKHTPVLAKDTLNKITSCLEQKNSEYRELRRFLAKRAEPKLVFWEKEHPPYFKASTKQQWVKKC